MKHRIALIALIVIAQSVSSLFSSVAVAADSRSRLFIQPRFGMDWPSIQTQGKISSYAGQDYSLGLFYQIGDLNFSWAPFFRYGIGKYNNTASTAAQTEKISETTACAGVKFYTGNWFLSAGYTWIDFDLEARGTSDLNISSTAYGFTGSLGYVIRFSKAFSVELSGNAQTSKHKASTGGFSSEAEYLRLSGVLGVNILIPSGR